LLRAEQERIVRDNDTIGIFDGGLDLDYHIFTRLFLNRNLLSQTEYDLCERLYQILRTSLPAPELTIFIHADLASIISRFQSRDRINIARTQDMQEINLLLETYFDQIPENNRIKFDVSKSNPDYPEIIEKLEKIIY
jgi:deoxyadenosine/deoxycytidine kinase